MIFDGGIVRYLHLTIPQSFCFAKIQPPLHKGAFLLSLTVQRIAVRDYVFLSRKLQEPASSTTSPLIIDVRLIIR